MPDMTYDEILQGLFENTLIGNKPEVADLASTRDARTTYESHKARQRSHLRPTTSTTDPP